MSKRNLILEIQEKNARASSQYLHGNLELYALKESAQKLGESDTTLRALHIMAILDLRELGYEGAYDRVAAFGRQWEVGQKMATSVLLHRQTLAQPDGFTP